MHQSGDEIRGESMRTLRSTRTEIKTAKAVGQHHDAQEHGRGISRPPEDAEQHQGGDEVWEEVHGEEACP